MHEKPNEQCCRDELFERLMDYGIEGEHDFVTELYWFLDWARRRELQVAGWLAEALNAIAIGDFNDADEIRSFATMMLKRYRGDEPQKRENPTGKDAVKQGG